MINGRGDQEGALRFFVVSFHLIARTESLFPHNIHEQSLYNSLAVLDTLSMLLHGFQSPKLSL